MWSSNEPPDKIHWLCGLHVDLVLESLQLNYKNATILTSANQQWYDQQTLMFSQSFHQLKQL